MYLDNLELLNFDIPTLAEILGHAQKSTKNVYGYYFNGIKKKAMKNLICLLGKEYPKS